MKPSQFCVYPWNSVTDKSECEVIALNSMKIMKRLGDTWGLSWETYRKEREKDGNFSIREKAYFDQIKPYINDADGARKFSKDWANVK